MRNGMIRGYVISYWPSDGSGTIMEKTVNDGQANMTELTTLMIFTSYNISVLAVTNERGEPSEVVTVTTNEDSEFLLFRVICLHPCLILHFPIPP